MTASNQTQQTPRLTYAQIEQGWRDTFSTSNPFCPCDLKTFMKAARWAEANAQTVNSRLVEALTQARTAFASIANGIPAHERYAHKCALSMDDVLASIPKEPT